MEFSDPLPFAEAQDKLRQRGVLPSHFDTYLWSLVPAEIRERAFFSSQVESASLLNRMKSYIDDYISVARDENGHLKAQGRSQFVADMRELAIREGLGKVDPETGEIIPQIREEDLTDIRSIARLQLIFDTQVEAAQEHGFWLQGQDENILWVWPCYRFIRVRPVMIPRWYHAENEGVVKRKDDLEFWLSMNRDFGVPWGPWGFNSGMGVEDVLRDEAEALGVIGKGEIVHPIVKQFNERLSASVKDMDPGIAEALRRGTGGTVAGGRLVARERVADTASRMPRLPGRMEPVEVPARKAPASAKILGLDEHPDAAALRATLTVVDSLHDDGLLGLVKLIATKGVKAVGEYVFSERTGQPLRMAVSALSPWPELTLLHEVAHWIDQQIFGGRDGFGSATGRWPAMARLVSQGETSKELGRMIRSEKSTVGGQRDLYPSAIGLLKIQARPEEIFARAYVEWACQESAHPRLLDLLKYADQSTIGGYGLKPADREKFRLLITKAFEEKGWK